MPAAPQRNRLLPWIIGVVIIALGDGYAAAHMFDGSCQVPAISQFLVLVVLPVVYLALMYLTLISQK